MRNAKHYIEPALCILLLDHFSAWLHLDYTNCTSWESLLPGIRRYIKHILNLYYASCSLITFLCGCILTTQIAHPGSLYYLAHGTSVGRDIKQTLNLYYASCSCHHFSLWLNFDYPNCASWKSLLPTISIRRKKHIEPV